MNTAETATHWQIIKEEITAGTYVGGKGRGRPAFNGFTVQQMLDYCDWVVDLAKKTENGKIKPVR